MQDNDALSLKDELKKYFGERFSRTQALDASEHPLEREIMTKEQLEYIYKWIEDSLDEWVKIEQDKGMSLVYYAAGKKASEETPLLISTDDYAENKANSKWVVPSALRLIEPEAVLHIIK